MNSRSPRTQRRRSHRSPYSGPQASSADIIYFARAAWDGPQRRAHHIARAIAQHRRVFYVEPARPEYSSCIDIDITCRGAGLFVVTPHLPPGTPEQTGIQSLRLTITQLLERYRIERPILWYDSAEALEFTRHLKPLMRVYDYQRRSVLTAGAAAEPGEAELLKLADIIFTSTQSVFETVRRLRPGAVFLFPDCPERGKRPPPAGDVNRPSPTDERLGGHRIVGSLLSPENSIDRALLIEIATRRPDLSFEFIGESPTTTPPPQVSLLGDIPVHEREHVIRRWDAALFPIESHRGRPSFPLTTIGTIIQLGIPVIATPTTDIVGPLGRRRVIQLAQTCDEFVAALDYAFEQRTSKTWQESCHRLLTEWTWEHTAARMLDVMTQAAEPYTVPSLLEHVAVGFSS